MIRPRPFGPFKTDPGADLKDRVSLLEEAVEVLWKVAFNRRQVSIGGELVVFDDDGVTIYAIFSMEGR